MFVASVHSGTDKVRLPLRPLLERSYSEESLKTWPTKSVICRKEPNIGNGRESLFAFWDGNGKTKNLFGNSKKSSRCLKTGIQGSPVRKYTGTGIPAHAYQIYTAFS